MSCGGNCSSCTGAMTGGCPSCQSRAPAGYPGAVLTPNGWYFIGGVVVGVGLGLFFMHLTGATSVRGAARATGKAIKKMW